MSPSETKQPSARPSLLGLLEAVFAWTMAVITIAWPLVLALVALAVFILVVGPEDAFPMLGGMLGCAGICVLLGLVGYTLSYLNRDKTKRCPKCGSELWPNFMTGGPATMVCAIHGEIEPGKVVTRKWPAPTSRRNRRE